MKGSRIYRTVGIFVLFYFPSPPQTGCGRWERAPKQPKTANIGPESGPRQPTEAQRAAQDRPHKPQERPKTAARWPKIVHSGP